MKLRAIYTNDPERFPRIDFRDGLNVVFARVRDLSLKSRDSHNLGKTFLIRTLDYPLLGDLKKDHPFRTHDDIFGHFVFFLELETLNGMFITVRRPVNGARAISIKISGHGGNDYTSVPESDWDHTRLGRENAQRILNDHLNLSAIAPFDFRKGLGYFLRRQNDYNNEFMTSRFGRGKDRDWKPYMTLLLGFNHEIVARKYNIDKRDEEIKAALREVERQGDRQSEEYDELRGVVGVKEKEVEVLRRKVNSFDFAKIESEITKETVRQVESKIADLNEQLYELEQERSEIERTLQAEFGFDLSGIQDIFREAGVALPSLLVREYEELIDFNRRISVGRRERLDTRLRQLARDQADIRGRLSDLNDKRVAALEIVTQRETLRKFRSLQAKLLKEEEGLVKLRQQLTQLDQAASFRQQLRRNNENRLRLVDEAEDMVKSENERYTAVRSHFADFARSILFAPAIMSTAVNTSGNLDFRTRILDDRAARRETDEGEGTSYKKVLCACFDLAILASWAQEKFYRFVYHDGIFEGLDNRRKVTLLDTVRRVCDEFNIQYILTVIDSDLPRDEEDNKLLFQKDEVIRELHDEGASGRLFRMPSF